MDVFVARHAILDRNKSLFGYELLFRSCQRNVYEGTDDTSSTLQVIANSLLSSGLQCVAATSPVFINFGRELLTSQWTSLFPPKSVVIEILETVQPDPEVIASCLALKELGYLLALDDVVGADRESEFVKIADFIKVDFLSTTRDEQLRLGRSLKAQGKYLLAEKVETHEDFEWGREAGYDFFQGFFFAKPTLLKGRRLPNVKVNALRLIKELQRAELDFARLESIIRCDICLTYKLFRYVNSALFARSKEVSAVKDALVILGELNTRRWITLATLPGLAEGSARELIVHALVRARFCEALAIASGQVEPQDAFIAGMFSLLDALVDQPLTEILVEIGLPCHIKDALLRVDTQSRFAAHFQTALAYEEGNWPALDNLLPGLAIPNAAVSNFYFEAIGWAAETFHLVAGENKHTSSAESVSANGLLALQQAIQAAQTKVSSESRPLARI